MAKRMNGSKRADPDIADTGTDEDVDAERPRSMLAAHLESSAKELLATIRLYVVRAGLASGPDATVAAQEVLQETAAEALAHAARFDPTRAPSAWLLGIAINVVKRRMTAEAARRHRELHIIDRTNADAEADSDADKDAITDRLAAPDPLPGDTLADAEATRALLAPLASDDAEVLRLALIEDCDAAALAARLGTTPGTARMRLHRALRRLRAAWLAQTPDEGAATTNDRPAAAPDRLPREGEER